MGEYFGAWRKVQQEHLALVESAFAPVPVLRAPYFEVEVAGADMLDRLAEAVFEGHDPGAVLHASIAHELVVGEDEATLRIDLPFAEKGDVTLRKIGLELIVRVGAEKRTIMLPPALAAYRTAGARFADGALHVSFRTGEAAVGAAAAEEATAGA